jgi:hypothetical protein
MLWRVRITIAAQRALDRLKPASVEVDQVRALLDALTPNPFPGERVPFITERKLLYSDVGRFRVLFQLLPSSVDPPGTIVVVGFTRIG